MLASSRCRRRATNQMPSRPPRGRRILPRERTRIALAKDCDLSLFRDIPVPGLRGVTVEHQSASRPDRGKIGRDAQAFFVEYPPMREVSRRDECCVDDEQHKADV